MIKLKSLVLFASVILLPPGCSREEAVSTDIDTGSADNATAQVAPGALVPESLPGEDLTGNKGRVVSTLDVPGYSYVEVESNGQTIWIAGSPVKLTAGEIINWDQSTVMRNFHSKTLNRTFAEVIFVSRIGTSSSLTAEALPAARPVATAPKIQVPKSQTLAKGSVVSVQNAANYTYLEIKTAADNVIWLAAPETPVNVDDTVAWQGGSLMRNFKSSTLDKTFPEIYFVTAVQINN
jgi:hypothetical protein